MVRLWLLFALVTVATADGICSICECQNNCADCKSKGLETHFEDSQWNKTTMDSSLTIVLLDSNEIQHLTPFPSHNLTKISLARNKIETIDDNCFRDLPNLSELDLSGNKLTREKLGPHIFMGHYSEEAYRPLLALTILRLGSNQIHSLHPDLFEHLPNLLELYIDNNPFTVLDKNSIMAIVTPPYLKVLDMSGIDIQDLPDSMLHTPAHLEVLNLASNRFTRPPKDLALALHLKTLIIDNNPFKVITSSRPFPLMPSLIKLKMNRMPNLTKIEGDALGYLPKLQDLECNNNAQLREISPEAFSSIPEGEEGRKYAPITKLDLSNNALGYLDHELLTTWKIMESINLQNNPWVCDCNNQWLIQLLEPIIEKRHNETLENFICAEPIEMRGDTISSLAAKGYHLRCLDKYGNRPEKDGNLLIGVLIITLLAVPTTLALVFLWRKFRYLFTRANGPADYSRTFYSRADHTDEF